MLTRWGREVDLDDPWPEHPRPQLQRRTPWRSLGGRWDHAVTTDDDRPDAWDGPIVVPFSPETLLSGVGRQLQPHERLWYHRRVSVPPVPPGGRLLLHLGAVDQRATVWVDGTEVGSHVGGYLPFTLDVTEAVSTGSTSGEHELLVRVRDLSETAHHARGKQRLDRGEIWYTAQSGVWQQVWLEAVPASYVADLRLLPALDPDVLEVTVTGGGLPVATASVTVRADGRTLATAEVPVGVPTRVPVPGARRWSPDDPFLHDVEVVLGDDHVTSYAGMRSVGVGTDAAGHRRLLLNGAVCAHVGVLDQGYWPESLLTPPSDAAVVAELQRAKDLGFTVLRKHAKVEPLRWYHHCDRLGLLVWQDVVNGGGAYPHLTAHRVRDRVRVPDRLHRLFGRGGREGRAGRREFLREVDATVALLASSPSVVAWTPFNEAWGQFDANAVARRVRALDATRLVMATSGWVDQGGGDLRSFHRYGAPFTMPRPQRGAPGRRPVVLSEFGGYSLAVPGHTWSDREHGYRRMPDADALLAAYEELMGAMTVEAGRGLSATVHTQLTDVEDEVNGLLTWDREVLKLPADRVRALNAALARAMTSADPLG